jgi:hypothetical protein
MRDAFCAKAERYAERIIRLPAMSHEAVADLVERYLNDDAFRIAFAANPEAAVADAGFQLDDDELAALHSTVSSHDDQPLKPRVSKYSFGS